MGCATFRHLPEVRLVLQPALLSSCSSGLSTFMAKRLCPVADRSCVFFVKPMLTGKVVEDRAHIKKVVFNHNCWRPTTSAVLSSLT